MPLPQTLRVDFSGLARDLVTEGLNLMLSAFYDKCTVRAFFAVFLREVQQLYDAAIEVQKARTLYDARNVQLDALGRIVGQTRTATYYSDANFFKWDAVGQGWDQQVWWVKGGGLNVNIAMTDETFAQYILTRIVSNHTLVSSIPETLSIIKLVTGRDVSFKKTGPNSAKLIVESFISLVDLKMITSKVNSLRADNEYFIPYPATFSLAKEVVFYGPPGFIFDRAGPHCWDIGKWAVEARLD